MSSEKSGLTQEKTPVESFFEQIVDHARGLSYGNLTVDFKVRDGRITEAHLTKRVVKLAPHRSTSDYVDRADQEKDGRR